MFIKKNVFYPVFLSVILFVSPTMAQIHFTAFKGVTEFFLSEFYSPTLGKIALDSGFIQKIRFLGFFNAATDAQGKRIYVNDTSTDPLWNVVKILFPSNSGQLGTITGADTNFAQYIKNPKPIALLLNYAKCVRDAGKGKVPGVVTQQFAKDIFNALEGVKMEEKAFRNKILNPLLACIRESLELEKKENSLYPKYQTEQVLEAFFCYQFNTQDDIWDLIRDLDGSIVDKRKPIPIDTNYWKEEDLPIIAVKEHLNLDDIFVLSQASLFTSPIPYKDNVALLSYATAYFYDREQNDYGTVNKVRDVLKERKIVKGITYEFSPFSDLP